MSRMLISRWAVSVLLLTTFVSGPAPSDPGAATPPTLRLISEERIVDVDASSFCCSGDGVSQCGDGLPSDPLPDLGSVGSTVQVSFR